MSAISSFAVSHYLLCFTRRRFALSLFYVQLLCTPTILSQRSSTSFGLFADYQLGFRPSGFTWGTTGRGTTHVAVAAAEQPFVHLIEIGGVQRLAQTATLPTQTTFRFITGADLNGDGMTDFVAISQDGQSLSVLMRQRKGTWQETTIPLAAEADRCVIADLNNDRRSDIVVYGKSAAGVATILGQARGKWNVGPVLFPDISVSDVKVMDLNGDGVNDIFMLDWLSNDLLVLYGISRLVYTEQVAVHLEGEPDALSLTKPDTGGNFLVAVSCPDAKKVFVYAGNAIGDYRQFSAIELEEKPRGVQLADINGDSEEDLVIGTPRTVSVALGTPAGFTKPMVFGVAPSLNSWAIADVDRDGKNDCVVLDEASRRLNVLLNDEAESKFASALLDEPVVQYAVGRSPKGLAVADVDGDGRMDIAVANTESASLSILLNKGRGRFAGQRTISTYWRPVQLKYVASARGPKTLIAAHPSEGIVSIVALTPDIMDSPYVSVPTGDEPYLFLVAGDSAKLKFLARYRTPHNGSLGVSLFEQIGERHFLEQSLRTKPATPVLALTIDAAASLDTYDLLYATHNATTLQTTVWHTTSTTGMQFPPATAVFWFKDSASAVRYLFSDYINRDGVKDVLVHLGPPANMMGIWYGRTRSSSHDSIEWIPNVHLENEDAFLIKDINGDSFSDLIWIDGLQEAVMVLYGAEHRAERRPVRVAPAKGAAALRVAGVREIGTHDVILAHPERGTISIIVNAFRR